MVARPLPVLPGAFYGSIIGEFEGLPDSNVFCWQSTRTTGDAAQAQLDATTIAGSMANQWGTHMMAGFDPSYAGSTARVYALQFPLSPAVEFHAINSGGGTTVGGPASPVQAALIKHTVARRGRGSQSRSYLAPLLNVQLTADRRFLTDGAVAAFTTTYNAVIAGVISDYGAAYPTQSLKYVQLSRIGTGATHEITGSACERGVAYQRRRARRRSSG